MNKRLSALEEKIRNQTRAGIWIDMTDNRVRIDVNNKRGKEMTFESVCKCAEWVEKRMQESEKVTGLAFVSNVMNLIIDEPFTPTPNEEVNQTGVVINLAGQKGEVGLAVIALFAWLHLRQTCRQSVDTKPNPAG